MLFLGLALLSRRHLRKSLIVALSSRADSGSSYSKDPGLDEQKNEALQPTAILTKISGISVPPFFELRLSYIFAQPGVKSKTHSLDSSCPSEKFVLETIKFPHRGKWLLKGLSFTLVDLLGITSTSLPFWHLNHEIEIGPRPFHCPRWPILASTIRVDDQINHPVERRGDMYDLKQYHPADGARKIVWKLFAKSGQLFSRYAEPAYSPEGKVALICLARKLDDKLASETAAYLEELENIDIEILVATLSQKPRIAFNLVQAKNLLVEDAWDSEESDSQHANRSINKLILEAHGQNNERNIQTVILAVSEESLKDPAYRKIVTACQTKLLQSGIRPSIFISSSLSVSYVKKRSNSEAALVSIVKNLLTENERDLSKIRGSSEATSFIKSLNNTNSDLAWS